MNLSQNITTTSFKELISYRPARLHTGSCWYISFHAFDPQSGLLKIKRIKINYIERAAERRKYANELMKRINNNLAQGWNPFLESEANRSYRKLTEAMDHFLTVSQKRLRGGDIRQETWNEYSSKMKNLQGYLEDQKCLDMYVYKFDKNIANRFLEYIYVGRDRTSQTRDNYLRFLRVFSTFLVDHEYLKVAPTEGLKVIGRSKTKGKNRTVITPVDRERLRVFLEKENKDYLIACMIEYYCFIRPKEMSYIQVSHINLEKSTIYIPGITAKNHKNAIVTIPTPLKRYLVELNYNQYPPNYYIFSVGFKPGLTRRSEKQFRDYWLKVRDKLNFPEEYKFYSLKDTGITDLIGQLGDPRIVRDQARHHSIAITDIYTPHDIMKANPLISQNEAEF
ncbi:MAG: site-specific integrase [Bacteroidetes bacterium]|nr:site-specific integrase [Bacteroidota bacterium]MBT3749161.1 site-specific integrase [Bacteroidota bacterium]MBT4399219.1 site-specific integrase [Bacteroidota bacterium]MBT4411584.1 site-specific integrase [Bacteroidota bacterium]MBT5426722.1 site-specific integrase [Bacteroidota bacterium]